MSATGETVGHAAFWKQVTNNPSVVEFLYTRSLGKPSESTATLYTPAMVGFLVQMQDNGLKIRFSDKLQFTNSHQINESFHFAVGGYESYLWSMGAAKQITYETVDPEQLQLGEPSFRIVASTNRSSSSNAVGLSNNVVSSPVLQRYRLHREEARKVLHLGIPTLTPNTLVVSPGTFKAQTELNGPLTGSFVVGNQGLVTEIDYTFTDSNVRKKINYGYEWTSALPSVIREKSASTRTNGTIATFTIVNGFSFPERRFVAEELSPQDYVIQNSGIRKFVQKDGRKFSIGAKGRLDPVLPKSNRSSTKTNFWVLLGLGVICSISILVLVKQLRKKTQ